MIRNHGLVVFQRGNVASLVCKLQISLLVLDSSLQSISSTWYNFFTTSKPLNKVVNGISVIDVPLSNCKHDFDCIWLNSLEVIVFSLKGFHLWCWMQWVVKFIAIRNYWIHLDYWPYVEKSLNIGLLFICSIGWLIFLT